MQRFVIPQDVTKTIMAIAMAVTLLKAQVYFYRQNTARDVTCQYVALEYFQMIYKKLWEKTLIKNVNM